MEKKLSEMKPGEKGEIVGIESRVRGGVSGMGIRKGKTVKISSEQPMGGPIVIEVDGNKSSLGKELAESVTVRVEE